MRLLQKKIIIPLLLLLPLSAYSIIITIAYSSTAGSEDAHAYERSKHFDEEKAAYALFTASGLTLQSVMHGRACELRMVMNSTSSNSTSSNSAESASNDLSALGAGTILWKRASNAQADFITVWQEKTAQITQKMPLKGRWHVEYQGLYNGKSIRAKTAIFTRE